MKIFRIFLLGSLLTVACQQPSQQPARPKKVVKNEPNTIAVAQVGPEIISKPELEKRLNTLPLEDLSFATSQVGQHNFIHLLVREKLAQLDAQEKGLNRLEPYQQALQEKRAELDDIYQAYALQTLLNLWEQDLYEQGTISVSEKDIDAYHKKYPYEMTIKQIIVDDAQTADMLLKELKHSKSRWKELERRYSVAPEQSRGKEISFMPGEFIPELEVIAANSATGSVQGFIKTTQGFHIIMKTGEKRLSLQDAAPRIRAVLENQKKDALFDALQNKYKVVIYE